MVGNNIRSSTGSMTITTALSTGLGNITTIAKGDVAVSSGTNSNVSLTSGTAGGAVNLTGLAVNLTSNGTAGDKTTLTSATSINLVPTTAILTDSKIATLTGFPTNVGSSIDFALSNPDYKFTISKDIIELNYFNTFTTANQQIFQSNTSGSEQAFFRQQFTLGSNTNETLIRNDINSHTITMTESVSGDGVKLNPTDIQFTIGNGFTSIRPKYFSSNGGQSFSVTGSPSGAILSLGPISQMLPSQRWKIEIGFCANSYVSDAIITYRVYDSNTPSPVDVAINSACSYQNAVSYPVPIQVPSSPTGAFISINDNFLVSGSAITPINIDITGGTFSGAWSGTYTATITLTYIDL
jgi:hypothetical protein